MGHPKSDENRLTILEKLPAGYYLVKCTCGTIKRVQRYPVDAGIVRSCGCLRREMDNSGVRHRTHGQSKSPEYKAWCNMKKRCNNCRNDNWWAYGGRGISYCKRWEKFENFILDMGEMPEPGLTLERIDNTKGYFPKNCRWATMKQQCRNRRSTVYVVYLGRRMPFPEAVELSGVSYRKLHRMFFGRHDYKPRPRKKLRGPRFTDRKGTTMAAFKIKNSKSGEKAKPKKEKKELTKQEKLALLVADINGKLKGDGHIYLGTEHPPIEFIPSGVLAFDYVTGGGFPRGAFLELFGPESSGKTLLLSLGIANAQRLGYTCAALFREGIDRTFMAKNGVDLSKLHLIESKAGDKSLEILITLLESGLIDLLVFDSVQSLDTSRESEDSVVTESYANSGAGQMWGRVMRKAYAAAAREGGRTAIVGISQARTLMGAKGHGPQIQPTGIWAIKHWKSVSVMVQTGEKVFSQKEADEKRYLMSREIKLFCRKNKVGIPDRVSQFTYRHVPMDVTLDDGEIISAPAGVDTVDDIFRHAVLYELIQRSGAWYDGYGIRAQGYGAFSRHLYDDLISKQGKTLRKIAEEVHKKILER